LLIRFRNVLVHDYLEINDGIVQAVVTKDSINNNFCLGFTQSVGTMSLCFGKLLPTLS